MARLAELALAVDPLSEPLGYPGRPAPWPALLVGDRLRRLEVDRSSPVSGTWGIAPDGGDPSLGLDAFLSARGLAPIAQRRRVLAVGSNAAPAQLRRKFAVSGASGVVPMPVVEVAGLVVGHSAHVSAPGYVPATPVGRPDASMPAVLLHLDDAQVVVLDATEPNYRRVPVAEVAGDGRSVLAGDVAVAGVEVYSSRHGVLGGPAGPWPFDTQRAVVGRLLAHLPHVRGRSGSTPAAAIRAWSRSPELRDMVRDALRAAGLVRSAGKP